MKRFELNNFFILEHHINFNFVTSPKFSENIKHEVSYENDSNKQKSGRKWKIATLLDIELMPSNLYCQTNTY